MNYADPYNLAAKRAGVDADQVPVKAAIERLRAGKPAVVPGATCPQLWDRPNRVSVLRVRPRQLLEPVVETLDHRFFAILGSRSISMWDALDDTHIRLIDGDDDPTCQFYDALEVSGDFTQIQDAQRDANSPYRSIAWTCTGMYADIILADAPEASGSPSIQWLIDRWLAKHQPSSDLKRDYYDGLGRLYKTNRRDRSGAFLEARNS